MSHNIIQKRLAFRHERSVTVAATLKAIGLPRILPRRLHRHCGVSVVTAQDAAANRTGDPTMSANKLTDTQLVLLSAAARHPEGAIELASDLKGAAAKKSLAAVMISMAVLTN
jgi:hypothetical protein